MMSGLDRDQARAGLGQGHAPAAAGQHQAAQVQQHGDGVELEHLEGPGGGDHPSPAATGVLAHRPAQGEGPEAGLVLGVEAAHVLARVLEGRVVDVHLDVGDQADDGPGQGGAEGLEQHRADLALAGGDGQVQGDAGDLGQAEVRAQQDAADLGPVAVGDGQARLGREGSQELSHLARPNQLLLDGPGLAGPDERIATQGQHYGARVGHPC